MKLYRAYSVVDDYWGYDEVKLWWFCVDRKEPVARYEDLIAHYPKLDSSSKQHAERLVNELFIGEELNALITYAWETHATEIFKEEVSIPVGAEQPLTVIPWSAQTLTDLQRRYELWSEEEYALPMKVEAFYNLQGCPKALPAEVFEILGLDPRLDKKHLKAHLRPLVEAILSKLEEMWVLGESLGIDRERMMELVKTLAEIKLIETEPDTFPSDDSEAYEINNQQNDVFVVEPKKEIQS